MQSVLIGSKCFTMQVVMFNADACKCSLSVMSSCALIGVAVVVVPQ